MDAAGVQVSWTGDLAGVLGGGHRVGKWERWWWKAGIRVHSGLSSRSGGSDFGETEQILRNPAQEPILGCMGVRPHQEGCVGRMWDTWGGGSRRRKLGCDGSRDENWTPRQRF